MMKPSQLYTVSNDVVPPFRAVVLYPEIKRHDEPIAFCMTIEEAEVIAAVLNASLKEEEKNTPDVTWIDLEPSSDTHYSLGYEAGLGSFRAGDILEITEAQSKSNDPYTKGFIDGWEYAASDYDCIAEPY